jgi:hypothetical protein
MSTVRQSRRPLCPRLWRAWVVALAQRRCPKAVQGRLCTNVTFCSDILHVNTAAARDRSLCSSGTVIPTGARPTRNLPMNYGRMMRRPGHGHRCISHSWRLWRIATRPGKLTFFALFLSRSQAVPISVPAIDAGPPRCSFHDPNPQQELQQPKQFQRTDDSNTCNSSSKRRHPASAPGPSTAYIAPVARPLQGPSGPDPRPAAIRAVATTTVHSHRQRGACW